MKTILPVLLITFLASCTTTPQEEKIYKDISEASLHAGDAIPLPPENEIVLHITGNIKNPNKGNEIVMSIETLEQVGLVEYTLKNGDHPYDENQSVYQGVLASKLLDLWGVGEEGTIFVTASDDYQMEVPIPLLRKYPIILATRENGEYISVANQGPIRFIYPYSHYDKFSDGTREYTQREALAFWVWWIKTIEVK